MDAGDVVMFSGDIELGSSWGHGEPMRRLIDCGALRGDRFLQVTRRAAPPSPAA